MDPVIMQCDNERGRIAVPGRRTDDGERCTLVVVHEVGQMWASMGSGPGGRNQARRKRAL